MTRSGQNVSRVDQDKIDKLAKILSKQIDQEIFKKKYAPVKDVLKLVGAGVFLASSIVVPTLPLALKPFLKNENGFEAWKRFNIPYLKRTIKRLEKQKLVEISDENGIQVVKVTNQGKNRILKISLDELEIIQPKVWDRKWRLISFDLPEERSSTRKVLVRYLKYWKFYPLHESVYLHAYPCLEAIDFLREYLGVSEYVRLFTVIQIENDKLFRNYFGIR